MSRNILWFTDLSLSDVDKVGGKNASLGEMVNNLAHLDVRVPNGFATTADAYRDFLSGELESQIDAILRGLDADDVDALACAGKEIRAAILARPFSAGLEADIRAAFADLDGGRGNSYAVRSSATAEDLPDASFAGQQETFLNVTGIEAVLRYAHEVYASLYNDRAIAYRIHSGYDRLPIALSVGVQQMVRSDLAASGVMFTIDTESGFDQAVFLTSSYGLGEMVVQGAVNPDEFYVYKPALRDGRPAILKRSVGGKALKMVYSEPGTTETTRIVPVEEADQRKLSLTDEDVTQLARYALVIEDHYGRPMDIEWAKDGSDGGLYIVQARPETVQSRRSAGTVTRYSLRESGDVVIEGRAIGQKIGTGQTRILTDLREMAEFRPGEVLVADMTDPDWEPIMKRASAIVTNRGGRTCHAAIIARELGIPAVVGTGHATELLATGQPVTVSCAEGDTGLVYAGELAFDLEETDAGELPPLPVDIMMNVGTPDQAFAFGQLPSAGVGLARLEFIINRQIGIHPRALLEPELVDESIRAAIALQTEAYASPRDYFVTRLAEGIATIAAAFAPRPVIVRLSDFKSNEYSNLLGGETFEPDEENPMLGWRGAARYLTPEFQDCFAMECEALRFVRDEMGLTNVKIMVPFVRTVAQAQGVIELLDANGLRRGENGLSIVMMCELPSNALLADRFLDHFDGFSIGSNDMTQLTLGLDRDSGLVADVFDERDDAVLALLEMAISAARARGKYIGICGQGPSDYPDFAEWLMRRGIGSISLNPDTVVSTWQSLSQSVAAR
ncbi:phosphoenolpyruvate synthase [Herbiconiux daphne]|uniref:Phosphoenolpyruvate synthase n=1 Tax=Herbiconiux daphne TaxID=2970914 RepID=A0ABT2H3S9_9MICO|nr:phosphoenolpyruvate synthase [Herbiconiux daphne]MCS5734561.1 phosphoenolpyruvate synthase [Herbiconiux daphne]